MDGVQGSRTTLSGEAEKAPWCQEVSPHLPSLLQLEPLWLVPLVFKGWVFKRRQFYDLCIAEQRKRRLRE